MSVFLKYFKTPENPSFSFDGDTESFIISGQNSTIHLNGNFINLYTNYTIFYNVKNITVENVTGEPIIINSSPALEIYYFENDPQILNNVYVDGYFDNLTVIKYFPNNQVTLNGSMESVFIRSISEKITIREPQIKSLLINGKKLKDFNILSFEIDNTSSIIPAAGVVKINAFFILDYKIIGIPSKIFLHKTEGIFGSSDHLFDLRSTDRLNVEIVPEYQVQSYFNINNTKISIFGFTNSAKLSDKDIIMNDITYWFEKQPAKINAIAVVISLFLTAVSLFLTVISTYRLKKDGKEKIILIHLNNSSYRIKGSDYIRYRRR